MNSYILEHESIAFWLLGISFSDVHNLFLAKLSCNDATQLNMSDFLSTATPIPHDDDVLYLTHCHQLEEIIQYWAAKGLFRLVSCGSSSVQ